MWGIPSADLPAEVSTQAGPSQFRSDIFKQTPPESIKLSLQKNMEKNALVIIDVQNYFVNEHTRTIPGKIARFISNHKFDFVLFTKFVNHEGSNYFKLLNWKKCLGSPDIDIHKTLKKFVKVSNIFEKTSYSVFRSKRFVGFLRKNQIKKLYLCGTDIDACVLASAFDAFDLGYEMEVLIRLSLSHSGRRLDKAALEIIKKNLTKKQ